MRSHILLLLCASSTSIVASGSARAEPPAEVTPSSGAEPNAAPAELSAPAPVLAPEPAPASPTRTEPSVAAPVAPGAPPELVELSTRIQALERNDPLDDSVRRPVDFSKAALDRSRASGALGDAAAEARTRQLARAAVELAEARLRLQRERALFALVQARRAASGAEQATAKQALERERARALELQRESGAP
ncbi:MAG: hypothetical protein JWN04_4298 [Myxococcaceae bacterium]|nr:hypothetical protein [Myxococcaceae bacterium]